MDSAAITESFDTFKSIAKHPEAFLMWVSAEHCWFQNISTTNTWFSLNLNFRSQNEKAAKIKEKLLEAIYTYSKAIDKKRKSKALPKLITNGLDDESIWQQLEIQNEETFQTGIKSVSKFLAASTDKFKLNLDDLLDSDGDVGSDGDEEDGEANESGSEMLDEEQSEHDLDEQDSEENDEDEDEEENVPARPRKRFGKTIVDDQFFKLREMEEFLQREDNREMNPDADGDESDEIDLFTADETNREESMKYSDFFDDARDDGDEPEDEVEDDFEKPDEPKSSHELKQERLNKKIAHMENAMLDNRPWQMKGEVKGDNRPQNSLLEEILEFDTTTRPAPIITEEVTLKLEDIIKQRIKDKAWDDVERKVKPSDIQIEYKKQLVLDQEKSKKSLAQIYEKEFIQEMEKNNPNGDDNEPEEPKEHKEIRAELKDLFEKLDLLSNFYYTPRPAQPELRIITNLPTISMEEVAPVAVSEAAMLAPEEIKRRPKGDVIGAGERTKTDKKRDRRHKKVFQKQKFQKQSISGKSLMEKVSKSRNVEKVRRPVKSLSLILYSNHFQMKTGDTTKSSSAFFSKLQEGISLEKNEKTSKKRKPEKQNHQAKKLKL